MAMPGMHRMAVGIDCECGLTIEASDDEELFDELVEHVAYAHESPMSADPRDLVTAGAYDL
ncbi:MAG: DUF1059 domain-containing protein [Candidatus Limnocylindria bacterium]